MPKLSRVETAMSVLDGKGNDKRIWLRTELDVRVRLRFEHNRAQQQCYCRSVDISEAGIGLVAPYDLERGQELDVEFTLPGAAAPLQTQGRVRNRDGFRYGLEFVSLSDVQRREIARFSNQVQSAAARGSIS